MEVPSIRNRIGGNWAGQLLASRRGALTIAAVSALLAGLILYLFVQHYRQAPVAAAAPTSLDVFVAGSYIPAGTPDSTIAAEGLIKLIRVPSSQAVAGAIADPSAITGEVSSTAIAAGQQIAVSDFTHSAITIGAYLSGDYRAIAIPFDASHGLTSYIAQGSTVDIMDDLGSKTEVVAQNVPVLANAGGDIVLRVSDAKALTLAGASDNSRLWLTLRPSIGAKQTVQVGSQEGNL